MTNKKYTYKRALKKKHHKHFFHGFFLMFLFFGLILVIAGLKTFIAPLVIDDGLGLRSAEFEVSAEVREVLLQEGKADVIIELKDVGSQDKVLSTLSGGDLSTASLEDNGLKLKHKYSAISAISGELDVEGIQKLVDSNEIKEIYLDPILEVTLSDSIPLINADDVWQKEVGGETITGDGQAVCIIDTGIDYTHPAFIGKVSSQHCYCSVSGSACCPDELQEGDDAMDDNGHGTHVAGIMVSNDATYKGVAPDANVVVLKTCNHAGYCSGSDIIAAIEWCTTNVETYNIGVISMSVGGLSYADTCDSVSSSMTTAVNNAVNNGIAVTIASGNNGYTDKISWPSCISSAISVGGVDKSDNIASYSNRNSILDYLAPGGSSSQLITSTGLDNGFVGKYGTSMATPHVAGAILLLKQYIELYNDYTPSITELRGLLSKYSVDIENSGITFKRIDVSAAIDSVLNIDSGANSAEKADVGKIIFSESTDLAGISEALIISENLISLDSSSFPQFNKAATLSIYNLSFVKTPVVLKDGEVCSDCSVVSYDGDFVFTITGFSNYSAGENSELVIWDETDSEMEWYEGPALPTEEVYFFANYTDRSNGNGISAGSCSVEFFDGTENMSFSSEKGVFELNRSFDYMNIYDYEVTCSETEFETQIVSNSISVNKSDPVLSLILNGVSGNISVVTHSNVEINASLTDPENESISLYLDGVLTGEGSSLLSNTSFADYGLKNITISYSGSDEYHPASNTLWIEVIVDSIAPQWNGSIDSPVSYASSHEIGLDWEDNVGVDSVWIEHNFNGGLENESVGESYVYTTGALAIGNYQFRFWANDSSGNVGASDAMNYSIVQGENLVSLNINEYVNQNVSLSYREFNVTGLSSSGRASLFMNDDEIDTPSSSFLSVGNYTFKVNSSGSENYTANSSGLEYTLVVNQTGSEIQLTLNGDREDIDRASGDDFEIIATLIIPENGTVQILRDGNSIKEGESPLFNTRGFSSDSEITAYFEGNENYSSASEIHWVDIIDEDDDSTDTSTESSAPSASTTAAAAGSSTGQSCTEKWECSSWSSCKNGVQTRTCSDKNKCGTTKSKPTITTPCTAHCTENWECGNWSECSEGMQIRTCDDLNKCGRNTKEENQECALPAPFLSSWKAKITGFFVKSMEKAKGFGAEKPAWALVVVGMFFIVIGFFGYEVFAFRGFISAKFKKMIHRDKLENEM